MSEDPLRNPTHIITDSSSPSPHKQQISETDTLKERIIGLIQSCEKNTNSFVPGGQLQNILTKEVVKANIATLFQDRAESDHIQITNSICVDENTIQTKGRRKLFALLHIIEKPRSIVKFIESEIYDKDLPLEEITQPRGLRRFKRADDTSDIAHFTFKDWSYINYQNFLTYQWKFHVPFFTQDTNRNGEIRTLDDQMILPWIDDGTSGEKVQESGYSQVYRVKIHPDHHDFKTANGSQSIFALKKLHTHDYDEFAREIETLKRFSHKDTPHLVQLLTAFKYKGDYYLLFPWAEGGNLEDLWRSNEDPPMSKEVVLWVSKQCYGIATGLHEIHERQLSNRSQISPGQHKDNSLLTVPSSIRREEYGLHGDIKPQNILWFIESSKSLGEGVLKISDFGITEFNLKETGQRSRHKELVMFSPTYRPPEAEKLLENTSPKQYATSRATDIWALGCVYLEFVTWLLRGWKSVHPTEGTFSNKRITDDNFRLRGYPFAEDIFFDLVKRRGTGDDYTAVVKESVIKWISDLHRHPKCTQYLHDFLGMIESSMLVADQNSRERCPQIKYKLKEMLDKCHADDTYALSPNPFSRTPSSKKYINRVVAPFTKMLDSMQKRGFS